jgi:hypothetical protein
MYVASLHKQGAFDDAIPEARLQKPDAERRQAVNG